MEYDEIAKMIILFTVIYLSCTVVAIIIWREFHKWRIIFKEMVYSLYFTALFFWSAFITYFGCHARNLPSDMFIIMLLGSVERYLICWRFLFLGHFLLHPLRFYFILFLIFVVYPFNFSVMPEIFPSSKNNL